MTRKRQIDSGAAIKGLLEALGGLQVTGNAQISGNLTVLGNINFTGDVSFSGATDGPLVLGGQATASVHAVRADRTITAGAGLTGGGNLTQNRTISVSFGGTGSATTVARSDHHHDNRYLGITAQAADSAKLNGIDAANFVQTNTAIQAGTGLVGGGTLAASRTLSVDFGGTGTSNKVARADHTHDGNTITLNNPNFAATTLAGAMVELFTHVNDGKSKVASAIIDMGVMGVSGSDTFDTLAAKIKDISKDATATPGYVLEGMTYYAGGEKKTGLLPNRSARNFYSQGLDFSFEVGNRILVRPQRGYYDGNSWVYISTPNLRPEYVANGVELLPGFYGTSKITHDFKNVGYTPSQWRFSHPSSGTSVQWADLPSTFYDVVEIQFRISVGYQGFLGPFAIWISQVPTPPSVVNNATVDYSNWVQVGTINVTEVSNQRFTVNLPPGTVVRRFVAAPTTMRSNIGTGSPAYFFERISATTYTP